MQDILKKLQKNVGGRRPTSIRHFDVRAYVREFSKNFSEGEKSIEKEGIGNFKCRFPNIQL